MYLGNSSHFRNMSAFSKRTSEYHSKRIDPKMLNLKHSTSKTTLEICQTERSQSEQNQTTLNNLGISQEMQSPRPSQFHIKTFIRFRPHRQQKPNLLQAKSLNSPSYPSQPPTLSKKVAIIDKKKILCQDNFFTYDHVFQPPTAQQQIYTLTCKQMVQHFVRGFNSTVFAYGQTGSGKTYTMFGDLNDQGKKGIIPNVVKDIFKTVSQITSENADNELTQAVISCSMLQIYKQTMIDLFSNQKTQLKIKQNQFFNVANLTIKQVSNQLQMSQILKTGNQSKKMRQTHMNEASSRSHVIFTVYLEVRKQHEKRLSKFNLVDLAGSQKVSKSKVEGEGLEEAKKINLSLSCLGNTINALLKRNDHIPYRQSKLTRLLYESLGGNSLTRLVVTCSGEDSEIEETLSSLKFAARAKNLKTNPLINTLRKSEKSVSRIVYENLKTNLSKAQSKLNKIKIYLNELKLSQPQQNPSQQHQNKQNRSNLSNTSQQQQTTKNPHSNLHLELSKYKQFTQKIESLLLPTNKEYLFSSLSKPQRKKRQIFAETMSNPFLLIADPENREFIDNCEVVESLQSCKSSERKDFRGLFQTKEQVAVGAKNQYWEVIKSQEKQIDLLKKKLKLMENNTPERLNQNNVTDKINIESQYSTVQSIKKHTQKRIIKLHCPSVQRQQGSSSKKVKQMKKQTVKIGGSRGLPIKSIYLSSPSNEDAFHNNGKPKSIPRIQQSISSIKPLKSQLSKQLVKQPSLTFSPRQFIVTQNRQQPQVTNTRIQTQLQQILQKLSHRNQYQRFEKNILLRQLQLLFDQKMKTLPNQAGNEVQDKQDQNKKITLFETNELLVAQIRYIQQLEQVISELLGKKVLEARIQTIRKQVLSSPKIKKLTIR